MKNKIDIVHSTLVEEINKGNYQKALETALKLKDRAWSLIYFSRINELCGYFELSLQNGKAAINYSKDTIVKIGASVSQAYALWRLLRFDEAHKVLDEVVHLKHIADNNSSSRMWISTIHNIRGLLYWKENLLKKALDEFEITLDLREKLGKDVEIGYTLNNIGNTFLKMNDFNKANKYFQKANQLRKQIGFIPGLAASQNSLGRLLEAQQKIETAQEHYHKSLILWKELGNFQFIGKAYRYLAINATYLQNEKSSTKYWKESDFYFNLLGNQTDLSTNSRLRLHIETK